MMKSIFRGRFIGLSFILTIFFNLSIKAQDVSPELLIQADRVTKLVQPNSNDGIFINQIGVDNVIYNDVSAQNFTLNISQNGKNNTFKVFDNALNLDLSVSQRGLDNTILKYNQTTAGNVVNQYIQSGTNQNLSIYGSNSISESLTVSMQGVNQNIVIRNFK